MSRTRGSQPGSSALLHPLSEHPFLALLVGGSFGLGAAGVLFATGNVKAGTIASALVGVSVVIAFTYEAIVYGGRGAAAAAPTVGKTVVTVGKASAAFASMLSRWRQGFYLVNALVLGGVIGGLLLLPLFSGGHPTTAFAGNDPEFIDRMGLVAQELEFAEVSGPLEEVHTRIIEGSNPTVGVLFGWLPENAAYQFVISPVWHNLGPPPCYPRMFPNSAEPRGFLLRRLAGPSTSVPPLLGELQARLLDYHGYVILGLLDLAQGRSGLGYFLFAQQLLLGPLAGSSGFDDEEERELDLCISIATGRAASAPK